MCDRNRPLADINSVPGVVEDRSKSYSRKDLLGHIDQYFDVLQVANNDVFISWWFMILSN